MCEIFIILISVCVVVILFKHLNVYVVVDNLFTMGGKLIKSFKKILKLQNKNLSCY